MHRKITNISCLCFYWTRTGMCSESNEYLSRLQITAKDSAVTMFSRLLSLPYSTAWSLYTLYAVEYLALNCLLSKWAKKRQGRKHRHWLTVKGHKSQWYLLRMWPKSHDLPLGTVVLPACLPIEANGRRTDIRLTRLWISLPYGYEIARVDDIPFWNCIVNPHVEKEWKSSEITELVPMLWITVIF